MDLLDMAVSFKSTGGGRAAKTPMGLAGQLRSDLPQSKAAETISAPAPWKAKPPAALSALPSKQLSCEETKGDSVKSFISLQSETL
ncbi:hypothetical protein [Domibacillus tundrae]|uniref:hypothetical protein n=1 Tax=Domibacillus tundrae TaxID=1587527 RepID=UPI00339701BE